MASYLYVFKNNQIINLILKILQDLAPLSSYLNILPLTFSGPATPDYFQFFT